MQKMILVDYDKCTGCRYCESVCTASHEGVCNPSRARIKVLSNDMAAFVAPTLCMQCKDAPCIKVCPREALARDDEFGRVTLDYDLCIGCKSCILVCPFGAMRYDAVKEQPAKCDFCDGDPWCVKACATGAIQFVDADEANLEKKKDLAEKLMETARRFV